MWSGEGGPTGPAGPSLNPATEMLEMGGLGIRDVSFVKFTDGSKIGPGNSFDISVNETWHLIMQGKIILEAHKYDGSDLSGTVDFRNSSLAIGGVGPARAGQVIRSTGISNEVAWSDITDGTAGAQGDPGSKGQAGAQGDIGPIGLPGQAITGPTGAQGAPTTAGGNSHIWTYNQVLSGTLTPPHKEGEFGFYNKTENG